MTMSISWKVYYLLNVWDMTACLSARKMSECNLSVWAVYRSFTDKRLDACMTAMKERKAHCGVVRGVLQAQGHQPHLYQDGAISWMTHLGCVIRRTYSLSTAGQKLLSCETRNVLTIYARVTPEICITFVSSTLTLSDHFIKNTCSLM